MSVQLRYGAVVNRDLFDRVSAGLLGLQIVEGVESSSLRALVASIQNTLPGKTCDFVGTSEILAKLQTRDLVQPDGTISPDVQKIVTSSISFPSEGRPYLDPTQSLAPGSPSLYGRCSVM